jgi:FKBP-type peptidyl-prolyl cis-trans isomerase
MVLSVAATAAIAADKPPSDAENKAFLNSNGAKQGVVVMPGIQYSVIKSGRGAQPHRHDCVMVNYAGRFIDGRMFEPTEKGKVQGAVFEVSAVIPGWTEVLQLMHAGDKWEVVIPAPMAYGWAGTSDGTIPPNQTLVFQIELLRVMAKPGAGCPTYEQLAAKPDGG